MEDEIDKHKAQVTSTLNRLARQVAAEKQERADKCKAFKVNPNVCLGLVVSMYVATTCIVTVVLIYYFVFFSTEKGHFTAGSWQTRAGHQSQ